MRTHLRQVDEFVHGTARGVEGEPGVKHERAVIPCGEAMCLVHSVAHHDDSDALPGELLDQRDASGHCEAARARIPGRQTGPRAGLGEGQQIVQLPLL